MYNIPARPSGRALVLCGCGASYLLTAQLLDRQSPTNQTPPPPQLSPVRMILKSGFCPEFYRFSPPPPPPPLVPHVKKTRNSLHEKAEKGGGWMFNFGCRMYRISRAFGAAAYRSRQGAGNLDIQNRHVILVAELMILITPMHSKKNSLPLTTESFRIAYMHGSP